MICKKIGILLLLIFSIQTNIIAKTNAVNTGLAFLKIGAGGRAVGMGEAYTAIANDASATYWNPAGLVLIEKSELIFTHNKWFQDISHNFLAISLLRGKNAIGISFIDNNVGGIERRVKPSAEPLGSIEAHDIMIGLSFARSYNTNLKWGITVKYLYEKIYLETAYGVATDLGLIYRLPTQGLSIGASFQNLGKMSKFKEEAVKLPTTLKSGLAYQLPFQLYGNIIIAADMVKILEGSFHTNFGFEFELKNLLALRFGYLTGYDERTIQGGLGLKFSRYCLDYGYAPFSSDIGNSHRISLRLKF
ncbi:MAG: PorV/PorQ family protein [bacterium]|nr:MAG: PorV/PorQ family protein [bacterium]